MIGYHLSTKQTTVEGRICEKVMIAKRLFTRREYYFSITLDRATNVSGRSFFTGNLSVPSSSAPPREA